MCFLVLVVIEVELIYYYYGQRRGQHYIQHSICIYHGYTYECAASIRTGIKQRLILRTSGLGCALGNASISASTSMACKQLQQLEWGPRRLWCPSEPCKRAIGSGTDFRKGDRIWDCAARCGPKAGFARLRLTGQQSPRDASFSQLLTFAGLDSDTLSSLTNLFPTDAPLWPPHSAFLTQWPSPYPLEQHRIKNQRSIARGAVSATLCWPLSHLDRALYHSINLSNSRPQLSSKPRDGAPVAPGKSVFLGIRRQHDGTSFLYPTHCQLCQRSQHTRSAHPVARCVPPSATLGWSQEGGHKVHPGHSTSDDRVEAHSGHAAADSQHQPLLEQDKAGPGPASAREDAAQLQSLSRDPSVAAARAVAETIPETQGPPLPRGLYDRAAQLSPAPPWDVLLSEAGAIEAQRRAESAHGDLARVLELLGISDGERRMQGRMSRHLVARWVEEGITPRLLVFRSYGFATSAVQRAFRNYPHLLSKSTEGLQAAMEFFLEVGVSKETLCTNNTTWACMGLDIESTIRPKTQLLETLIRESIGEVLERCPRLLLVSQSSLARNAETLRAIVGPERFPALVQRNPRALTFQSTRVQFIHRLVQTQCTFSALQWSLIFGRMCALPANESLIGSRMEALIAAVGEPFVAEAVLRDPTILSVSPAIIEYNMARILEMMPEDTARALVLSKTQLLTMDWERRIKPALDYLQSTCGFSGADILRSHAYTRSLEGVLKPRVETVLGLGMEVRVRRPGKGQGKVGAKGRAKGEGPGKGEGEGAPGPKSHDRLAIHLSTLVRMTSADFRTRFPTYTGG